MYQTIKLSFSWSWCQGGGSRPRSVRIIRMRIGRTAFFPLRAFRLSRKGDRAAAPIVSAMCVGDSVREGEGHRCPVSDEVGCAQGPSPATNALQTGSRPACDGACAVRQRIAGHNNATAHWIESQNDACPGFGTQKAFGSGRGSTASRLEAAGEGGRTGVFFAMRRCICHTQTRFLSVWERGGRTFGLEEDWISACQGQGDASCQEGIQDAGHAFLQCPTRVPPMCCHHR